ncbi:hypothetical protein [Demequina aestuarii]|uniref:hypothetical protein n=1 Tax=Demequina aestuarii TaxID=327095 RepID=UPI000784DC45|nr:hypothetical protein [Demequina aestuarii]
MEPERRDYLRRRYSSLGWGEWLAACVFAFVAAFSLDGVWDALGARGAVWWALMPLLAVLLQAGAYWLMARRWVGRGSMPGGIAWLFLALRALNVGLLVVSLAGIVATWPGTVLGGIVAIAIWLFGVAEYVNYFVTRLAYRPGRWWRGVGDRRTPQLVRDVREGLSASRAPSGHV